MKNYLPLILLFALVTSSYSQNKTLGVGVAVPNPNAALHVESPTGNQGFIMPRLTTVQRVAMVLTATDNGLMVYDIDLKANYIWDGATWANSLTLPAAVALTTADLSGTGGALYIEYNGTDARQLLSLNFSNAANPNVSNPLSVTHAGQGAAAAVTQSGTLGTGGIFQLTNPVNSSNALRGLTNGTGIAGNFVINNAASTAVALRSTTNGSGPGIYSTNTGTGNGFAGLFENTIVTNTYPGIQASTAGTGTGVRVIQNATSIGGGMDIFMQNATSSANGFSVDQLGLGGAGRFVVNNAANTSPALNVETNGLSFGIRSYTTGAENAGYFEINNSANTNSALATLTNTNTGNALYAGTTGGGRAAFFDIFNTTNTNPVIQVQTNGLGKAGDFKIINAASGAVAVTSSTNGLGPAAFFENTNTTVSGANAVTARINSNTSGTAIDGQSFGLAGHGGAFYTANSNNSFPTINSLTQGTGNAGDFSIFNPSNTAPSLIVKTNGTGSVIFANHTGASGNIAIFQSSSTNVARITKTGLGIFNAGTQVGGADVAELFEVEGAKESYEPGDVLVISETTDRTVEKSSSTNSTKVVGVYATKPGVTLTEKGIDENLDQLVPMGVIGVIPTKVCLENGAIKRGDMLVTSSTSGHAMKAISVKGDGMFPAGVIIGKALENFDQGVSGLIKVLVNVK